MKIGDTVTFIYNKLSPDVGEVVRVFEHKGKEHVTVKWELFPHRQTYSCGEIRIARPGEAEHRRGMRRP